VPQGFGQLPREELPILTNRPSHALQARHGLVSLVTADRRNLYEGLPPGIFGNSSAAPETAIRVELGTGAQPSPSGDRRTPTFLLRFAK
jgi:hypothetical protein